MSEKRISLRIDEETLKKLDVIAQHYGLSKNSLVIHLTKQCVMEFENRKGEIMHNKNTAE